MTAEQATGVGRDKTSPIEIPGFTGRFADKSHCLREFYPVGGKMGQVLPDCGYIGALRKKLACRVFGSTKVKSLPLPCVQSISHCIAASVSMPTPQA